MSSTKKWHFRLRDILDAIDKIQRYTTELRKTEFAENEMAVDAVIRNFQIIGEAARYIPSAVKLNYPQIPWSDMEKMRHVLVHDYDRVNISVVWTTLKNDLPPLVPLLQALLQTVEE